MARKKGMIGPGAGAMGGPGLKPARPATAAAGRPPPVRPPGASPIASAPGPSPGMGMGGGMGGPPKGGGIGGAPGFNKGGKIDGGDLSAVVDAGHKKDDAIREKQKFAKGGNVDQERNMGMKEVKEKQAFRQGGAVKYERGGDVKGRTGRDGGGASKSC